MAAGRMDRWVTLQFLAESQASGSGEVTLVVARSETIAAEWLPASSTEAWQAGQRLQATVDGVFRIHWRSDLDPRMTQIVFEDVTYDMKPPVELGRRRELEIPVTAHV